MTANDVLSGAVLEEACLTLEELASAGAVTPEWVIRHVEEGVIESPACAFGEWRFGRRDLVRVRCLRAVERDFDAGPELAALVADLQTEVARLRARLRRAGLD